jgi:hypothetical protein
MLLPEALACSLSALVHPRDLNQAMLYRSLSTLTARIIPNSAPFGFFVCWFVADDIRLNHFTIYFIGILVAGASGRLATGGYWFWVRADLIQYIDSRHD